MEFKPVLISRVIKYECGCQGEFPVVAGPDSLIQQGDWNPIPCYKHNIQDLYERLNVDWRLLHNGKL